ncbi:DNA polymerase delta catalytic subunit, partial [Orchesella cincta]
VSFRDFMIQMDPDIITGYNIKNFDLPYLIGRAEKYYHTFEDSKRFAFMGRLKKIKTTIRPIINQHKQMNRLDKQIVNIQGRIVMDMFPLYVIHDVTRTGVKPLALKSVAKRHLKAGEEKDDVKWTEINTLQNGDSKTRKRLAKYCVQDSFLPIKLMQVQMPDRASAKMDFLQYYFEKSRLGGTILRYLVNKSRDYDKYFKQVRVQRNDGRVKYHPDSPEFKKLQESGKPTNKVKTICKLKNCNRTLFTDD